MNIRPFFMLLGKSVKEMFDFKGKIIKDTTSRTKRRQFHLHIGRRKLPRPVQGFKFTRYAENPNQRRVEKIQPKATI